MADEETSGPRVIARRGGARPQARERAGIRSLEAAALCLRALELQGRYLRVEDCGRSLGRVRASHMNRCEEPEAHNDRAI